MNIAKLFSITSNSKFDWLGILFLLFCIWGLFYFMHIVKIRRDIRIFLFVIYIILLLGQTLFMRASVDHERFNFHPFWSYLFVIERFAQKGIVQSTMIEQIILNIIMFIPMGFMLPVVVQSFRKKYLFVLLIGFLFSLLIETFQYIFHVGLCEFDDIFNNTIGAGIGLFSWCKVQKGKKR